MRIHDIGCIARERDGQRGFEVWVGGGLGAVPYQAKLFDEFLPEAELLPLTQAISRVFGALGRKEKSQHRALEVLGGEARA